MDLSSGAQVQDGVLVVGNDLRHPYPRVAGDGDCATVGEAVGLAHDLVGVDPVVAFGEVLRGGDKRKP
ncbi:hypothetical protein ABT083_23740 [Streptomyces goshikiensis]|uniref:hypothetical protein n=1 Tax=Streptomyces goshikiensis TaxID=1942 RepID=UPI00332DBA29